MKTKNKILINEKMVEEGYAKVETFEKMRKPMLFEQLLQAETWAKDHHNGMWLDEWMR
ncbi:thermonuclease family protein [Candidatus Microgenomates bacterium]|nr:thermonuclease family protein [Candidatus Microgenomates bacterium]